MDIPEHYLQARTKAGRAEIQRRENTRGKAITELKQINDALGFVELAEDLNVNQTKLTVAKQRVMLNTIIEKLQDSQLTKKAGDIANWLSKISFLGFVNVIVFCLPVSGG